MTNHSSSVALSTLMFTTGIGIPIMAALSAGLGARMGSPWVAVVILFLVGTLAVVTALAITGLPTALNWRVPPYFYMGGLLVAFYVLSVTWAAPRIGVGNAIFFVLIGQIVAAAAIDQFGLFGALEAHITPRRWLGIALMAAGVFFARRI